MSKKSRLNYLVKDEYKYRDDFILRCCNCYTLFPNFCREEADSKLIHWNYCPMCGVKFDKEVVENE